MTSQTSSETKNQTVAERINRTITYLAIINDLIAALQAENFKVNVEVSGGNEITISFSKTTTEIYTI